MNILICSYLIFYLENSVNHYLNHVQLNEVTQHKIHYDYRDFFLKSSKIFKFENYIKEVIKCVKLYDIFGLNTVINL